MAFLFRRFSDLNTPGIPGNRVILPGNCTREIVGINSGKRWTHLPRTAGYRLKSFLRRCVVVHPWMN